jgi:putative ABC transport system permease protein
MAQNQIVSAYRNFIYNRGLNAINIAGLAIGMMAVLFIYQYIRFEKSYDNYQANADRIYRMVFYRYYQTGLDKSVGNSYIIGEAVRSGVPEVENLCRATNRGPQYIRVGDRIFKEERALHADSSLFDVFTYSVLLGVKEHFLREPNTVIITKSTANKYFGTVNAVGKILYQGNSDKNPLTVQGVIEDIPQNSHLKFDLVISLYSVINKNFCYTCNNIGTYFLLRKGVNCKNVEAKIDKIARDYRAANKMDPTLRAEYHLQPLRNIHLHSDYRFELDTIGNYKYINALMFLAVFILISAWLNYTNIYASILGYRINNVIIKKINGASQQNVVSQFLVDSIFSGFISLIFAILFFRVLFPVLNNYLNLDFSISSISGLQTWVPAIVVLIGLSIVFGLVLGIFVYHTTPSGFNKKGIKGLGHRSQKIMLVSQFVIATFLIICTLFVVKQIRYMQHDAFSMDIEQTLVVKVPGTKEFNQSQINFQTYLKQIPGIAEITYSNITPGEKNGWVKGGIHLSGKESATEVQIFQNDVSPNFFNFFGVKLLAGRQFFEQETNWNGGTRHVILNKEAATALAPGNIKEILGKTLFDPDDSIEVGEIVGVVDGFFQNSLDQEVRPTIFNCDQLGTFIYIKIRNANIKEIVGKVQAGYQKHFKGQYWDYYFLDEFFNNQYKLHIQFNRCFVLFSIMAIIIACLSLLGMVVMVSNARTKEIGIRKVNGSTISQIIMLLVSDFTKWVIIAFIIACPISWYAMHMWIQSFAYKTGLSWWVFALAEMIVLMIALLTVSWQSWKAATRNPVEALRYE